MKIIFIEQYESDPELTLIEALTMNGELTMKRMYVPTTGVIFTPNRFLKWIIKLFVK